jgi:thioredoxin-related protein
MKKFSFVVALILGSILVNAQEKVSAASDLLATANKQAALENKNVILIFHASWCGWCHKMDSSMNDRTCKKFFDDNYVTVHLTVDESAKNKNLENPGANEIRKQFHGDSAGLPFWLILDKNGNLLADSYMRKPGVPLNVAGENIGCPASEAEVAAFIQMLKKSSRITDSELAIIATRFKKNK